MVLCFDKTDEKENYYLLRRIPSCFTRGAILFDFTTSAYIF